MAKQDTYARYTVRIPDDLYESIKEAADDTGRSVNAEIVARLQASFESDEAMTDAQDYIADLQQRVERLEELVRGHDEMLNPGRYRQP